MNMTAYQMLEERGSENPKTHAINDSQRYTDANSNKYGKLNMKYAGQNLHRNYEIGNMFSVSIKLYSSPLNFSSILIGLN